MFQDDQKAKKVYNKYDKKVLERFLELVKVNKNNCEISRILDSEFPEYRKEKNGKMTPGITESNIRTWIKKHCDEAIIKKRKKLTRKRHYKAKFC